MHYYTYLSTSKIDMLYDQISNLSGKEVSFSGEGSLLAVKGGVDVKTKITTTTQEKIDVIREELELEGSLGQIGSPHFLAIMKNSKLQCGFLVIMIMKRIRCIKY